MCCYQMCTALFIARLSSKAKETLAEFYLPVIYSIKMVHCGNKTRLQECFKSRTLGIFAMQGGIYVLPNHPPFTYKAPI